VCPYRLKFPPCARFVLPAEEESYKKKVASKFQNERLEGLKYIGFFSFFQFCSLTTKKR
jgi:hypothetical protein